MISKNEIKRIRSLHRKKGRRREGAFIVEGLKGVEEARRSGWKVDTVYVLKDAATMIYNTDKEVIAPREMEAITALSTASDHLAVVRIPDPLHFSAENMLDQRMLILNDLADPGNLGTILRTADWFGIRTVLLSERCVDAYNPKVVQASMGSIFRMNLIYADLPERLNELKRVDADYPIIAAVMDGGAVEPLKKQKRGALIIGSESHGVSDELLEMVDLRVTIPGVPGAESLNASVAAGILMHAWAG